MSAITLLGEGIRQGDWAKVCAAYLSLTDEVLTPPDTTVGEQRYAELVSELERILSVHTSTAIGGDNLPAKPPTQKRQKTKRKAATTATQNQPGEPTEVLAADLIADSIKQSQHARKKAYRPSRRYVDVTCSECRKKYSVHPENAITSIGDDTDEAPEYVCDTCLGRSRR